MKVLTSTVFDDIDPFADSDEDEERIINPTCRCESAILLGYQFHHFGQSPNRILSSFDDFGYNVYVDSSGVEHRFFAHHYQGVVMSGTHDISEVDKSGLRFVTFEKDNSVIPEIRKMLQSKIDKLFCRYCKENGHELEECPKIKCRRCGQRGHIDKNCTVDVCDHCQKVGHTIDNCYRYNNICRFCKMSGHAINNCPNVVCRHCDDNHFSNQCPYMSSACKN